MTTRTATPGQTTHVRGLGRLVGAVVLSLVLVVLLAYGAASVYLTGLAMTAERHLAEGTPADLGLAYAAVTFTSPLDGIELHGWYLPAGGQRAVIFIHGIHGNRWDTFHHIDDLMARHVRAGFDVLTFDMRAHGESGGDRFTLGSKERVDLRAAVDLVAIPPEKAIPRIAPRPILLIHGDADTRIPLEHSRRLFAAAHNPAAELWIVPGAGHVLAFTVAPETYAARVLDFFGRATLGAAEPFPPNVGHPQW